MYKKLEAARALDRELKSLVRDARAKQAAAARALVRMKREGLFRPLGYARVGKAKDLIEIGERIERLPAIKRAYEEGELPWTKARQVVRVATAEDERTWLALAKTVSSRELERAVALAKGERPKVRILLELTEEDAADLDEAVRRLREERDEAVPLAEAVGEIARRSLGSPVERPGYQVVIQECSTCGAASRDAGAGEIPVSKEELATAKEDAEVEE
jgi:hypothetical protein